MDKVFRGLRVLQPEERLKGQKDHAPGKKFCISCHNVATQFAIFDCLGVTILERYCDSCIGGKKHLKETKEEI